MRVLLDENLDRRLKRSLADEHEVLTVAERGWRGMKNGDLLRAAEGEFDALLTADRGIPYQQNLPGFDLAVVILEAKSNSCEDLAPLADRANEALQSARPGEPIRIRG